jgi:hypothetical protein
MNAWFPLLKRKTVLLVGVALVVAGLVPVLYFLALFTWQFATLFQAGSWVALPATLLFIDHSLLQAGKADPVLSFVPQFPWAWLTSPESLLPAHTAVTWILGRVHLGLVFALVGLSIMGLGIVLALRQRAAIRAEKQRKEDRLRRVRDYRHESSRPDNVDGRREPFIGSGAIARNADRRWNPEPLA